MYEIININRVNEPQRGQNYSEFYYTTYITVKYTNIEEPVLFKFLDETAEERNKIIEDYIV